MRHSALHARHASRCVEWQTVNGMAMPLRYRDESAQWPVLLADMSCGVRVGLKGPGAAAWLATQGLAVPVRHNSRAVGETGTLVCRLGETEFLVEDALDDGPAAALAAKLSSAPADVYPVLRQDVSLLLCGQRVEHVLLETCSLDFRDLSADRGDLALTAMVGVSVTILPVAGLPAAYRIWADPSFGPYLWETLLEVVEFHGGGPAGWAQAGTRRVA